MSIAPFLIIIAATLWALDALLRRHLYGLPPSTLIFFEHLIGFVLLLPFVLASRETERMRFSWVDFRYLLLVAMFSGIIGTLLFTMALAEVHYISFSVVLLIQKLQPLFAITSGVLLAGETIGLATSGYIVLALIAGYFVTFPQGVASGPDATGQMYAAFYALGAAAAWGVSTTFSKILLSRHPTGRITILRYGLTATIIGIGLLIIPSWNEVFRIPNSEEFLYIFAIACSTGVVAMYIYYRGLRGVPVYVSAILELTWPIVGVVLDYVVYGNSLTLVQYIAATVLFVSMYRITRQNISIHVPMTPASSVVLHHDVPFASVVPSSREGIPQNLRGFVLDDVPQRMGMGRGKKLVVPTINFSIPADMPKQYGVYASRVTVNGQTYAGALHYGSLPTFDASRIQLEVYLIDEIDVSFPPETRFRVEILDRIRDTRAFLHPDALRQQIHEDIERIREILG